MIPEIGHNTCNIEKTTNNPAKKKNKNFSLKKSFQSKFCFKRLTVSKHRAEFKTVGVNIIFTLVKNEPKY